jgi:hypothetical protein
VLRQSAPYMAAAYGHGCKNSEAESIPMLVLGLFSTRLRVELQVYAV